MQPNQISTAAGLRREALDQAAEADKLAVEGEKTFKAEHTRCVMELSLREGLGQRCVQHSLRLVWCPSAVFDEPHTCSFLQGHARTWINALLRGRGWACGCACLGTLRNVPERVCTLERPII